MLFCLVSAQKPLPAAPAPAHTHPPTRTTSYSTSPAPLPPCVTLTASLLPTFPPIHPQVDPKTDGAARDWVAIFDECRSVLLQEIDYTNEGRNADQFRENFAGQPWVKVPEIIWDKSGQRVLTMEYCPGLKINRVEEIQSFGLNRELLARYSVESYLQQILRYGFFHADPHVRSLSETKNNEALRRVLPWMRACPE